MIARTGARVGDRVQLDDTSSAEHGMFAHIVELKNARADVKLEDGRTVLWWSGRWNMQ